MRATVKQFYDGLDEMRKIYPFKDEETLIGTVPNQMSMIEELAIQTVDKDTGIRITMEKNIVREGM